MKQNERNPPTKEHIKQIGNTIFTVKSIESDTAKQPIKMIVKKLIEKKLYT